MSDQPPDGSAANEPEPEKPPRVRGKVISFNRNRGFGFASGPDGRSFFVHHTELIDPGVTFLVEGQEVEFTPASDPRGDRATQVHLRSPRVGAQAFRTRRRKSRQRGAPSTDS